MKFTIPLGVLKAISLFRSRDETRGPLTGTLITVKNGRAEVVACNGRFLGAISVPFVEQLEFSNGGEFCEVLDISTLKGRDDLEVLFDTDLRVAGTMGGWVYVVRVGLATQLVNVVPGVYPQWQWALPTDRSVEVSNWVRLNAEMLGVFGKAAKFLTRETVITMSGGGRDGTGPLHVALQGVPEFVGILMPVHGLEQPKTVWPEWIQAHQVKAPSEPVAAE